MGLLDDVLGSAVPGGKSCQTDHDCGDRAFRRSRDRSRRTRKSISPLRTDSLPLVSKIYWPENADDAIMNAP